MILTTCTEVFKHIFNLLVYIKLIDLSEDSCSMNMHGKYYNVTFCCFEMFFFSKFDDVLLITKFNDVFYSGERCYTPNNYYGTCVLLPQCPSLVNYYGQSPNHPTVINFLLIAQRNCGTRSIQQNPLVCCIDPVYYRPQPQPQPQPIYRPVLQTTTSQPIYRPVPETTAQPVQPVEQPPPEIPSTNTNSTPILNEKLCQDPNGINGVCKSLKECPAILSEFLAKNKDTAYVEYIKRSNENCRKIQPFICCPLDDGRSIKPTESTESPQKPDLNIQGRLLTPNEGCGFSKVKNTKIVGGQTAKKG